jgi:uncharacterized membrane protein
MPPTRPPAARSRRRHGPHVKGLWTPIGLAVIGVSGWLGGKLAYRYGVRVADEDTQAEGFRTS